MKSYFLTLLFSAAASSALMAQDGPVSLPEAIAMAREQSTTAKIAGSIKENRYFQYQSFKAGMRPQLGLTGNLLGYSRDYFGVVQPDGTLLFQPRTQNYSSLGLSLSQQIGFSGGTVAVNSSLTRFDDFDRNEKRYSGIPINISLTQPLFAFNSYKWDKKIEPLKYQEAEKEYVKANEEIGLQVSKLYFDVLDAQADLDLAKKNIESQEAIYEIENKRIDIGTTTKEKILQLKLQLLTSTQELNKAEVALRKAMLNLKSYVGVSAGRNIQLIPPLELPPVNITTDKAIEATKANRPEFIAYVRKKLEAEKNLQSAKKERFQVNLFSAYGYNNTGQRLSSVYQHPNSQHTVTLGVQLPILDWGRNKGKISVASSNLKTISYTNQQEEIMLIQEVTNLVENLKLMSSNIKIANEADNVADERYTLLAEQFRFGKTTVTDLSLALSEKDAARRSYITSLRNFWEAYYQLKSLTLIDLDR